MTPGMRRNGFSCSYGGISVFWPKEWLCIVREGEQEEEGNKKEPLDEQRVRGGKEREKVKRE